MQKKSLKISQKINKNIFQQGYIISILFVVIATGLFFLGRGYLAKGQWGLLYLLIVLAVAGIRGARPAILTAVLSFFAWNYFFIPPYQTLLVSNPEDWLLLLIFSIVAIIVGLQTGRLKERETLTMDKERETELLKNFSVRLVSDISLNNLADLLIKEVKEISGFKEVAVFFPDNNSSLKLNSFNGATKINTEVEKLANWSYSHLKAIGLTDIKNINKEQLAQLPASVSYTETGLKTKNFGIFLPFQTANKRLGVLFVGEKKDGLPFSFGEVGVLIALVYQVSAFLERKKLQKIEITAKARNQSDRFKSTIISSIHHELKTPLSSINATITNLLEKDTDPSPDIVKEELRAIKTDLNRLNSSIGSLVDLSRLETADWKPKKDWYELGEILGNTLSRITVKDRSRILIEDLGDSRELYLDFIQIGRVFQIIIENALAYSGSSNNIKIRASFSNKIVQIFIEDNGPGIDNEDKDHIFDKFFRGKTANSPGTGLGLAIALELVNFHGGNIEVKDADPQGALFIVTLPAKKRNYWER